MFPFYLANNHLKYYYELGILWHLRARLDCVLIAGKCPLVCSHIFMIVAFFHSFHKTILWIIKFELLVSVFNVAKIASGRLDQNAPNIFVCGVDPACFCHTEANNTWSRHSWIHFFCLQSFYKRKMDNECNGMNFWLFNLLMFKFRLGVIVQNFVGKVKIKNSSNFRFFKSEPTTSIFIKHT